MLQKQTGLYREPPEVKSREGKYLNIGGRRVLNFASNDYLGLGVSGELRQRAARNFGRYGTSSSSSRLVSGNLLSRTDSSFRSVMKAERGKETAAEAELLYAAVDYDHNFKKGILHDHYKKVFSCLQSDLKTG